MSEYLFGVFSENISILLFDFRYNQKADVMLASLVITGASVLIFKPLCNNLWTLSIVCFIEGITWTCVNAGMCDF